MSRKPLVPYEFDCILGGVVTLKCTIDIMFGQPYAPSLKVAYQGQRFDCDGIILDYVGEFLPLTEYLVQFAKQEIKNGS